MATGWPVTSVQPPPRRTGRSSIGNRAPSVISKAKRYRGVAIAVGLLCVGIASSAKAAPRAFYGVFDSAERGPSSAEIARMGAGGVGTLRINLVWAAVHPTPNSPPDWLLYDRLIGDAAANGIRVLATVYSTPTWAATNTSQPPTGSHRSEFAAFVREAAQRYGSKGTYWDTHPVVPQAADHLLAVLERAQLAQLLVPEAERKAVRVAASGIPDQHQER